MLHNSVYEKGYTIACGSNLRHFLKVKLSIHIFGLTLNPDGHPVITTANIFTQVLFTRWNF